MRLHIVAPGDPDQISGGYLYNRRVAEGLAARRWRVIRHGLPGLFPGGDGQALRALTRRLGLAGPRDIVLVDSLALVAMGRLPPAIRRQARGAIMHHPASCEISASQPHAPWLAAERRALRTMRRVIATSPATASLARRLYGLPAPVLATVRPGCDRPGGDRPGGDRPGDDRPGDDSSTGQPPPWRLLTVGAVTGRKDLVTLLRALAILPRADWILDCHGRLTADSAAVAAARAAAAPLGDRVRFHGETDPPRLRQAYAQAHIYLTASRFEGYGMALADALARGLPAIAVNAGPTRAMLPPDAGYIVPAGAAGAIAACLAAMMGDPGTVDRLRAGAARAGARLPGWDETVRDFERALRRTMPCHTMPCRTMPCRRAAGRHGCG